MSKEIEMTHSHRWDQGDPWDKRPIRPAAYLIVALFIAFAWDLLASTQTAPTDNQTSTHLVDKASPILFGVKIGTTGSGDSHLV
jgi:hypothetical protein